MSLKKILKISLCGALIMALGIGTATAAKDSSVPQVKVTGGKIQGYVDENGVRTFKGVPFADTTAGENRWRAPQTVKHWKGVKYCTKFGQIAVQSEASTMNGAIPWTAEYLDLGMTLDNGMMGEDCLSLNIWTKANRKDKLPVIVYIHGGANMTGSSQNDVYSGREIAQKGVVYVSINYRVGIFGFLAYKDKTGEEVTGNFAIMDQIAALKWIKDNISKFGGDPNNITIMGQSAGSINVQHLIASSAASGLFNKAVALSFNTCTSSEQSIIDLKDAEAEAEKEIGRYTIAQLRNMKAADVLNLRYTPRIAVKGTSTKTEDLLDAFRNGKWNRVNMIWGGVQGDQFLFDWTIPVGNFIAPAESMTPAEYSTAASAAYGSRATEFLKLYPAKNQNNAIDTAREVNIDKMISDYYYAARQKYNTDNKYKTYIFYYDHVIPDTPERMAKFGAFHTSDVNYWLNHFTKVYPRDFKPLDYALGEEMSSYLVNFAKTGDPNGKDSKGKNLPRWNDAGFSDRISYLHIGDKTRWTEMSADKSKFWQNVKR